MKLSSRAVVLSLSILSLSTLASAAAGQEQREREGRGRGPAGFLRSFPLMAALDENSDGELSEKEIEEAIEHLKELDSNKDRKLSGNELVPAGAPGGFGPGPGGGRGEGGMATGGGPNPTELVEQLFKNDKNGDDKLSKDELPGRLQAIIERSDADKDGFLTREEIINSARRQGRAQGGLESRSGNTITPPGANPELLLRRFMAFDKDEDGKLSREELEQSLQGGVLNGRQGQERRRRSEEDDDDDDDRIFSSRFSGAS